jgi:hypothetical protein
VPVGAPFQPANGRVCAHWCVGIRHCRRGRHRARNREAQRFHFGRQRRDAHVGVVDLRTTDVAGQVVDEQFLIRERLTIEAGLIIQLDVTTLSVSPRLPSNN